MRNPGWSESVVKYGILGTPTVSDLEEGTLKERPGQKSHGAKDLYISRCANVGKISSEVWNLEGCKWKNLILWLLFTIITEHMPRPAGIF